MRTLATWTLALTVLATVAGQAQAQRGGFGGRPFGGGNLMLLGQKSVQDEIKLTDEQIKKVDALADEQRTAFAGLRDLDQQERRTKLAERVKAQDDAIASLLNADQLKRLKQIAWQQRGGMALGEDEVASALGLSQEQKDQVMTIQRSMASETRNLFQGGGGDREESRKKLQEARQAANEKALGVLSAEQKEKWQALVGEPFKGEIAPPMRRGRPGGAGRAGARAGGQAFAAHGPFHLASYATDGKKDDKPADPKQPEGAKPRAGHGRAPHGAPHAGPHRHARHLHHRGHAQHVRHRGRFHHGRGPLAGHAEWHEPRGYAARGPHAGYRGAPGRWHDRGPRMAFHHRGPHARPGYWHSRHAGPGYAHTRSHHHGWRGGPPHRPPHHMASWHRGPDRHHFGPPHFRPRGPETGHDRMREHGPPHRSRPPQGPPRDPRGSGSIGPDVESQLTDLEQRLNELSRQLAAALAKARG